ncbi:MAG: autotransporter outer membrane beta-barrel domain-containing protein [Janthinobacterium lividum]
MNVSRAALAVSLAGGIGATAPARADNLTISGTQTTAVATATAANGTPGDITIATGGSIAVGSGTAATINSNNTLTNATTIASGSASNTVAVLMSGAGLTSANFVNNGSITINGASGSGNTGLLIGGAAPIAGSVSAGFVSSITVIGDSVLGVSVATPFTGNIAVRNVTVSGATSTAVSVTAPITGNLTLLGTNSSTGKTGYGLFVAAPVSGVVDNGGTISVGSATSVDSTGAVVAPVVGLAGERIAASVGGGLLNDRYYVDANGVPVPTASVDTTVDALVTGSIITSGAAPALWVAPCATAPQNIAIGAVGTGDDAYAIVNRGGMAVQAGSSGQATTGIMVGGGGATTTLAGGINSQASSTLSVASLDATATGVSLLAGAVVPQFRNQGAVSVLATQTAASGSIAAGAGGAAYGVLVAAGATLQSVVNTGTMVVTSTGTGNGAYGIVDRSSTLASIVNTGTISTTAGGTGTGAVAHAIDLSASTGPATVANSGTIIGDIVFGNGASTLQLAGGTVTGAISFGSGANTLAMSGTSAINSRLTSAAPLAVTLADTARLNLSGGPMTLTSLAASGNSVLVVPVTGVPLQVNGAASFTGTSTVVLSLQSLALNQSVSVINATGGISTDHLATLIDASSAPYLFTATAPTLTGTTLDISLVRKTAAQIGLTGSQAALYDQSVVALADNPVGSGALANLTSQGAVVAAYRQITPPSFGRAQLRAAQSFADTGFGAAADRLTVVDDVRHNGTQGVGVWGQQVGDFSRQQAGTNEFAYHNSAYGIAGGVDMPLLGLDAVGVALLADWATIHHDGADGVPATKVPVTTLGVEPYASWSWKALFVQATGLAAHVAYKNTRTLTIGTFADSIDSHWSGVQLGAGATVGARLNFGRFRLTPTNSIFWTSLTQNSYTEQGGGDFALNVQKQKDNVTSDTARLALAYLAPVAGGTLKLEGHGGYTRQFNANPTETKVDFVSGGDTVTLNGDAIRDNEKSYGAGVGFSQNMLAVKFNYDRRQAQGFHDQAFVVTAGVAF